MKFSFWDFLSILMILGIIGVVLVVGGLFANPASPVNPFPPATDVPEIFVPSSTPTLAALPPTWTPTVGPGQELLPSGTPKATNTPIASRTPFVLPTLTPKPIVPTAARLPLDGKCRISNQSPADGTAFAPGTEFKTSWTIENTSDNTWAKSSVDIKYKAGDAMQKGASIIDLPQAVAPGKSIDISITMIAPTAAGSHITYWNFVSGSQVLCTFYVEIQTTQ